MTGTIDLDGDPNIGVYARVFEDVAIVYPGAPREFTDALAEELDVDIVATSIQGSIIIGSLVAGNSQGLVVSNLATPDEVATLKEHRDVLILEGSMNAAGNVILANDHVAAVHPTWRSTLLKRSDRSSSAGGPARWGHQDRRYGWIRNSGIPSIRGPRRQDRRPERVVDLPIGLGS